MLYVENTKYFNTKIETTDILVWKKFLDNIGVPAWRFFSNENPIFLSDQTIGLAVFESGLIEDKGKFIVSTYSKGTWADGNCLDVTYQVINL